MTGSALPEKMCIRDRRSTVPNQAIAHALEPDIVSRLARFFPEATPVRIPIKLSLADGDGNGDGTEERKQAPFRCV